MRYFVDERVGIIAVRDRELTDPDYPGLHPDTEGVVWSEMGDCTSGSPDFAGDQGYIAWSLRPGARERAAEVCRRMNETKQGD